MSDDPFMRADFHSLVHEALHDTMNKLVNGHIQSHRSTWSTHMIRSLAFAFDIVWNALTEHAGSFNSLQHVRPGIGHERRHWSGNQSARGCQRAT